MKIEAGRGRIDDTVMNRMKIFLYKMNFYNLCDLLSMKRGVNMRVSHLVKQAKKGNKEALL